MASRLERLKALRDTKIETPVSSELPKVLVTELVVGAIKPQEIKPEVPKKELEFKLEVDKIPSFSMGDKVEEVKDSAPVWGNRSVAKVETDGEVTEIPEVSVITPTVSLKTVQAPPMKEEDEIELKVEAVSSENLGLFKKR
jgi:hypothetical protein